LGKKEGMSLHGSSKAAINLLTKAWAAEYGPKGVRVIAVSPGPTRTEGTAGMGEVLERLAGQAPAGRPATSEELAEAIVFRRQTAPVSFTAQNSRWMEDAPPLTNPTGQLSGFESRGQRIESQKERR
jgi:NAD(P)-dependent dehydrogenase (short-subunit alcohol dehydrogenase family)